MPLTSWNPASGPLVLPVPRSTRKLNCTLGRSRKVAIQCLLFVAVSGPLADAEDYEFSRAKGCYANQANQPAIVEIVLCHGGAVAADKICFLRLISQQRPILKFIQQEVR